MRLAWALVVALLAAAIVPAAAAAATAVPGEVIVRFAPGAGPADARHDARVQRVRASRLPGVQVVKVRSGQSVAAAVRELERRPGVRYAEPNYVYRASAVPNDYNATQLWGLAKINAPAAWDLTTGSAGVKVAVVDSGIAYDHDDLAANYDAAHSYDFVGTNDADPYDVDGHGTHVAGTIGAVGDNANGVTGLNWAVSLLGVRVLDANGSGTDIDVAEGLDYAGANARVANVSLGGPGSSQALHDAIAAHPNTLYVVAAGNDGTDNDAAPDYPCNIELLNVVCVAATTQSDGLAGFSNRGLTSVDLGAPGTSIRSTVPHTLTEDFEVNPGGRWTSGGTSQWGWVLDGGGNHFITDSPAGSYLPNADTWVAAVNPIARSETGCTLSFPLTLDVEQNADFLDLESSPTGAGGWTSRGSWTGSSSATPTDADLDTTGSDTYIRFRLRADGANEQDGAFLDDIHSDCVQKGAWNDYGVSSGTSMAAPHVSGVAALALALRPTLTVSQLRDVLLSAGDPVPALDGKTVTGRRLNARNALNPPPARVSTAAATGVGTSGAVLNGTVNPLGTPTSYQFQLGRTTAYGAASAIVSAGTGVGARAVSAAVTSLSPATTYHYRTVWIRGAERVYGADRTFTTAAAPTPPPKTLADITAGRCTPKRTRLRCTLHDADALAAARLVVKKGKRTVARRTVRPSAAGALTLKLKRKLRNGRYVVAITLRDAGGNTRRLRIRFRVRS